MRICGFLPCIKIHDFVRTSFLCCFDYVDKIAGGWVQDRMSLWRCYCYRTLWEKMAFAEYFTCSICPMCSSPTYFTLHVIQVSFHLRSYLWNFPQPTCIKPHSSSLFSCRSVTGFILNHNINHLLVYKVSIYLSLACLFLWEWQVCESVALPAL